MSQVTSQVIHKPVQSGSACGLPKLKLTDFSREIQRKVLELQQTRTKITSKDAKKRKSYVFGIEKEDSKTKKESRDRRRIQTPKFKADQKTHRGILIIDR